MANIILIGFSGTGKTAVGREVARLLAWEFMDTDEEIVRRARKPIEAIFAQEGEPSFRQLEAEVLREALSHGNTVVSTGGGAMVDASNRELMLQSGFVACLEARPETIYKRLFGGMGSASEPAVRPLLAGPDPMDKLSQLKAQRQPFYALAHWTVHTDELSIVQAASEVIRGWQLLRPAVSSPGSGSGLAAVVPTSQGIYPVYVGWGLLEQMGPLVQRAGLTSTAYIISEDLVFYRHGRKAHESLERAGISTHVFTIPPGEPSKTLETASHIHGWLADLKAERGHLIIAIGGGVVGDLAGFVAATYNRGMPFVQVPTTLLAMVDASIGGKTAVNLPHGKNLVGVFHQPRLVIADVQTLTTLPLRELRAGWAEAIKHALILDTELFQTFERESPALFNLEPDLSTRVIRRSMAIKSGVVAQDERETLGVRTMLNYGHTVGHALEAVTGYTKLLHGEAISIGMTAAAHISNRMGLLSEEGVKRQRRVLQAFELPTSYSGVDVEEVMGAMGVDKKTTGGNIRWVLLEGIGKVVTRTDVPRELVVQVLAEVLR